MLLLLDLEGDLEWICPYIFNILTKRQGEDCGYFSYILRIAISWQTVSAYYLLIKWRKE